MTNNIKRFHNLLCKGKIGNKVTKNRVKHAACSVPNFNTIDGFITDREFARMEVICKTGCGIITNQGAYPDKKGEGKAYFRQLSINDDKYIPGLRKIADMIHENEALLTSGQPDDTVIGDIFKFGNKRLDIQQGRAVNHIQILNMQDITFDAIKLNQRQPDRIGTARTTSGEYTSLSVV